MKFHSRDGGGEGRGGVLLTVFPGKGVPIRDWGGGALFERGGLIDSYSH